MNLNELLNETIKRNASDLHLVPDYRPTVRINGELIFLIEYPNLTGENIKLLLDNILTDNDKNLLYENHELDISYSYQSVRFRVNVYFNKGELTASLRLVPNKIKTINELLLPSQISKIIDFSNGLILITGQSGQGKSTTMAAIINEINLKYSKHIVTIEDPIEFIYPKAKSIVSQREIRKDTLSWNNALKSVLRQDPDVILIGEMRDQETIKSALTISETGHLVFSTLHTITASQTMDRIIDAFDSEEQNQIRFLLANNLRAIICQKLIFSEKLNKRVPVCEILFNNNAISNVIREGKTYLIDNIIMTSGQESMILFEKYLYLLFEKGIITQKQLITNALRPSQIKNLFKI